MLVRRVILLFSVLLSLSSGAQVFMHPNRGQWDERIQYKVDMDYGYLLIENQGITYQLFDLKIHAAYESNQPARTHVVKTHFIGSKKPSTPIEQKQTTYYRNYFIGRDSTKWKTHVNDCQDVRFKELYPGIQIHYESSENEQLKYSFEVNVGANPNQLKMQIDGSDKLSINANGELVIATIFGDIIESAPTSYTIDENGGNRKVDCKWVLQNNVAYFELGNYNHNQKLIIDPQLTFSTFTGSTADNWGFTACSDPQTNLFAGGIVFGAGYPTTTGAYDVTYTPGTGSGFQIDLGITKFNAIGTALLYSTYVGGTGNETPNSIVSNSAGELFILGVTSSTDFPMGSSPFQSTMAGGVTTTQNELPFDGGTDIYIARLSAAGDALLAATYIGGTANDGLNYGSDIQFNYGDCFRGMIEVDQNSNVYFASSSQSADFPNVSLPGSSVLKGTQDGVYGKLDPNLSTMSFCGFIGGNGFDSGNAIQLSHTGDIFLVGGTTSGSMAFGTAGIHGSFQGGDADGFVAKINPSTGIVTNGTFLGTNDYDQAYFVQLDLNDDVYVLGQTKGSYPITSGIYSNPSSGQFIHKLSNNLATSHWSTTVGASSGHEEISPTAFLVSDCFDIYFSGWGGWVNQHYSLATASSSSGFPVTTDAFQSITNGNNFYIAVLKKDAAFLKYATYFGGTGSSYNHVDGGTSQFDKGGRIYHAVCGACGGVPHGFTSTPGAWSNTNNSSNCNLAAFKFELNTIESVIGNVTPIICMPNPVVFANNSLNGNDYVWNFGDGSYSFQENPTHQYSQPGTYQVSLITSDSTGCYLPDTTYFTVTMEEFQGAVQTPSAPICPGDTLQLQASGGGSYAWSPAQYMDDSTSATPNISITQNTTFQVIISDSCGTDTLQVQVQVFNSGFAVLGDTLACLGDTIPLSINTSNYTSIDWEPAGIFVDNQVNPALAFPSSDTTIQVHIVSQEGCQISAPYHILVDSTIPKITLPDSLAYCQHAGVSVTASGGRAYQWLPNYSISATTTASVYIDSPTDTLYYVTAYNGCGSAKDSVKIHILTTNAQAGNDTTVCPGEPAFLWATGGEKYAWYPSNLVSNPFDGMTYGTPNKPTHYSVVVTDSNSCTDTAYVYVNLYNNPTVTTTPDYYGFAGDVVEIGATASDSGSFSWSPTEYIDCPNCQYTHATPPTNMTYIVTFIDEHGCKATDDISIHFDALLYVPNTFTPDGDAFNAVFKAVGGNIKDFNMMIFDRWGELIFQSNSMDIGWNGTYKGMNSPDGVYVWKINYTDLFTKIPTELIGHVTLLR